MFHTLAGGSPKGPRIAPREAARALFCSNFVGIALARSLHFQFYVWYFYSLPLLAWSTRLPVAVRVALLVAVEAAWNPWAGETSSTASSVLLTVCHLVLLAGLLAKDAGDEEKEE
jgi:alpha-1,3-mannosyltransferase